MDGGIVWVIGFVCVAIVAWLVLRPRHSVDPAAIDAALGRGATVLDVRTPGEFSAGHVDGARNVPVDSVAAMVDQLGDREAPIVVYCRSGNRSARAKRVLDAAGFTDVLDAGAMGNVKRTT